MTIASNRVAADERGDDALGRRLDLVLRQRRAQWRRAGAGGDPARRPRRRARLRRVARGAAAAVRALRPARLRTLAASARRARRLLDAGAVRPRAERAARAPRDRGSLPRGGAVVGRNAGDGARGRAAARAAIARHRQLSGVDGAVGHRDGAVASAAAHRRPGDPDPARGGRHHRQRRVRAGHERVLRTPPVPSRAVPRAAPAHVRSAGRGPDRVSHDERTQRVPCRRLPAGVGHHPTAARGPRRRRRWCARSSRRCRTHAGSCSKPPATARTSSSRSGSSPSSSRSSPPATDGHSSG